jgi:hypothetical protein
MEEKPKEAKCDFDDCENSPQKDDILCSVCRNCVNAMQEIYDNDPRIQAEEDENKRYMMIMKKILIGRY